MVMDRLAVLAKEAEQKLGLPPLAKLSDSLNKFPDAKQLKLIKDVLTIAERVSQSAPELDQVAMLIKEINSMPIEKLERLEKLLKRIEKIIKTAPQELMEFIASLKEE
ncbi:hypothetical protein ES703_124166 [subsurface metagenome]